MFWSVRWPLLWAGGFVCNLDILYGGLGIGKLQFLIKKKYFFLQLLFFFNFWSLKPWIRIGSGSVSGSVLASIRILWIRIRKKWIRIRNPGFFIVLWLFLFVLEPNWHCCTVCKRTNSGRKLSMHKLEGHKKILENGRWILVRSCANESGTCFNILWCFFFFRRCGDSAGVEKRHPWTYCRQN